MPARDHVIREAATAIAPSRPQLSRLAVVTGPSGELRTTTSLWRGLDFNTLPLAISASPLLCDTRAVSPPKRGRPAEAPMEQVIEGLDKAQLVELISTAAERHDDVERVVRLVAARADGDLAALRAAVDRGLRTRRFLDYRESMAWAHAARPVVAELGRVAVDVPSRELVELVQRAIGHVVKVIMHADDSSGLIGDLAHELLRVHATACDAGVADPAKLAGWMVRFRFEDQDFFEVDPVRSPSRSSERSPTSLTSRSRDCFANSRNEPPYAR